MITVSAFTLARPADTRDHDRGEDWTNRAACLTEDPELFFPHPSDTAGIEAAKDVCRRCPVRDVCQERALDDREPFGVWGGMDEQERRRVGRRGSRSRATA